MTWNLIFAWCAVALIGSAFFGTVIAAVISNRPRAEVREDWWKDVQ